MRFIKNLFIACLLFSTLFAEESIDTAFTRDKFLKINESISKYLVKTPLIPSAFLTEETGKLVFLKDESRQIGLSFKTRGVMYEVMSTAKEVITTKPRLLRRGVQLVTQTDGNHGVALIISVTTAIKKFAAQYPLKAAHIKKIEPIIFTYQNILPKKREAMQKALEEYRQVVGDNTLGKIIDTAQDYGTARAAREKFLTEQGSRAIYMEHGGIKTMQGHASAAIEILDQLKELGIDDSNHICLMLPIGAGGPIGLAAALKALHPNSSSVMVQTPRYGAFVTSYKTKKLTYNDDTLSPYTVVVDDDGKAKNVIYEDGISVDGPESQTALDIALKYLDDAVLSDPKHALEEVAPLLLADCDAYYRHLDGSIGIVGGTTAIVGDALLMNAEIPAIKRADVVVLFGTEGSIDEAIAKYTRKLMNE